MQAPNPSVAHDEYMVTRTRRLSQLASQRFDVLAGMPAGTQPGNYGAGIPTDVRRRIEPNLVRIRQRRSQRFLMDTHSHCVRSRLQHGDDAGSADTATQPINSRRDGRRMVCEVIVDSNTVHLASHLHSARHPLERLQGIDRVLHSYPSVTSCGDGREAVLHVMGTNQRPLHRAAWLPRLEHFELRVVV